MLYKNLIIHAEAEKKIKTMITLLEEDDNSSVQRAEAIGPMRKKELAQMLDEFKTSYCSLAEEYDHLRSNSRKIEKTSNTHDLKTEVYGSHSEFNVENPDVKCHNGIFDFKYLNRLADELISTASLTISSSTETEITADELDSATTEHSSKDEMTMNSLIRRVTKLIEENLRQQAELLKRNKEKRNIINALRADLEQLKREGRYIHNCPGCLKCSKVNLETNPPRMSRSNGTNFGKFFKMGCS